MIIYRVLMKVMKSSRAEKTRNTLPK